LIVKAWLTDNKQVMAWVAGAGARGIAWFLAGRLGFEATQSTELGTGIAEALAALVIAGISIYTSIQGRKKLNATAPAAHDNLQDALHGSPASSPPPAPPSPDMRITSLTDPGDPPNIADNPALSRERA